MDDITKKFAGALSLCFGILLFRYIFNETKKKNGRINTYDINVYISSGLLILLGLFLICVGIKNLI